MTSTLPFALGRTPRGRWQGKWTEAGLRVALEGNEAGPHPALLATLVDLVDRWPEVRAGIEAFVQSLPADHHVPLAPPRLGGFAARSCGFDQGLAFEALLITDPTAPERATVHFYTGCPDGYATYALTLVGGVPAELSAFAS